MGGMLCTIKKSEIFTGCGKLMRQEEYGMKSRYIIGDIFVYTQLFEYNHQDHVYIYIHTHPTHTQIK